MSAVVRRVGSRVVEGVRRSLLLRRGGVGFGRRGLWCLSAEERCKGLEVGGVVIENLRLRLFRLGSGLSVEEFSRDR